MATDNLSISQQTAPPYTGASPTYTPSLGTNLEGLSYYSSAIPLLDLMKSASKWIPQTLFTWDTGNEISLDADGWVTSIPEPGTGTYDRVGIAVVRESNASTPGEYYVVLYQGEGTIQGMLGTSVIQSQSTPGRLVVQAASDGSVQLQITSTDPAHTGNYIRDMHVVRQDLEPLYDAGMTFDPTFLDRVDDFHTFRFMDFMNTNQVFGENGIAITWNAENGWGNVANAPLLDWADRPHLTDARWDHGIPVEALVQAANQAGTDVWFNMPVNASDDYVRMFAQYVHENLDPRLHVHVEFSNEVWNFNFVQSVFALEQAQKTLGSNGNWMEWYGMRTAQVGAIWKEEFGEAPTGQNANGRVSVVFNTQFEYRGLESFGLETEHWLDADGNHIRAADYFDEYAVTGYYGNIMSNDIDVETVRSWWLNPDGGYTAAIEALSERIATYNTPLYQYHAQQSVGYGLDLVTYESGFSEQTPRSVFDDPAYTSFLINLQRDPRIYDLEQANYAAFKAAGGALYMNFVAIGAPSVYGSWGALESVLQETSPRYQALTDWNAAVAPWYETGRDPATFQNARIYHAGDTGEIIAGTLHGYDVLVGGSGNDTFVAYGSGSSMDGGAGFNTALLPGLIADYTLKAQSDGSMTITSTGGDIFTIRHVQILIGNDGETVATGIPVLTVKPLFPIVESVVTSGSGIADGSGDLQTGAEVSLTLMLSEAVSVYGGTPELILNNGGVATYASGSGSAALTFNYRVGPGESTADLYILQFELNGATVGTGIPHIFAGSGQSLTDANGHVFSFGALYNGTDYSILRDGFGVGAGTILALVNGTVWDHTSSYGWYADNGGNWIYQSSEPDLDRGHAADLSGAVTNPAGILRVDSSLPPPPPPPNPASPIVESVVMSGAGIVDGAGDLQTGAELILTLNMSEAVSIYGGAPTLILNNGGVATYTGGSGSEALQFHYQVGPGENTGDLTVTQIDLNGATVGTGIPYILAGSGQSLTDANGHVFSFGSSYNGTDYLILRDGLGVGAGKALALYNGTVWDQTTNYGWYSDNNGSWVYQSSEPALGGGHAADLSGAVTNPAGILRVDATLPSPTPTTQPVNPIVESVVASGAGIVDGTGDLQIGAEVSLTVHLSEGVSVYGGAPTLILNNGGIATYQTGSGSSALTFQYTVGPGENTSDLTILQIELNGATVGTGIPRISAGSGQSLTDANGHVFSFGATYNGADNFILRDGLSVGAGATLALVNGTVWDHTANYGWYADNAGTWVYQNAEPDLSSGHVADLTAAVANPTGILRVDTTVDSNVVNPHQFDLLV